MLSDSMVLALVVYALIIIFAGMFAYTKRQTLGAVLFVQGIAATIGLVLFGAILAFFGGG